MLGTAYATNIAGLTVWGEEGWRFAFRTVALIAMIIGWITTNFASDPNYMKGPNGQPPKHKAQGTLRETIVDFVQARTLLLLACKLQCFSVLIAPAVARMRLHFQLHHCT